MTKVPGWKIRRELGRLRQQLSAIPEAVWEPLAQARHDRQLAAKWPVRDGAHPGADRVAVILIWQPNGIAPSVLRTIAHVSERGYAPFVVSNASVAERDAKALGAAAWKWMERPNFGYDFGGYRDAVRLLRSWNAAPERLIVLNDSTWFPLYDDDETLERMAAMEADVAGSILRRRDATRFLESYVFSISSEAWRSEAFWEYWNALRITSNKYKVIRRGERGFSMAMMRGGLSVKPLFRKEDFLAVVAGMKRGDLREAIRFASTMEPAFEARRLHLVETEAQAGTYRDLIGQMLDKGLFYSTFPTIAAGRMGYPFMKKSRDPISALWRRRFVEAVGAGVLKRPEATIWEEMQAATVRVEDQRQARVKGVAGNGDED